MAAASAIPSRPDALSQRPRPQSIYKMENHDQAYYIWRDAGMQGRVLVHVDAHHDMWRVNDGEVVNIANFVCQALKEGIIREVSWIVPDRSLRDARSREKLIRQARALAQEYGTPPRADIMGDRIVVPLGGRLLTITTLDTCDFGREPVLLDIDVDYLLIPVVAHNQADVHSELPWRWPADLIAKLAAAQVHAEMTTISYSVEGCYTPLAWKYLGDEIADRLRDNAVALPAYDRLREGALAAIQGDFECAAVLLSQAAAILPEAAAPHYHLALLAERLGRTEEARSHCARALSLDPSYATGFNTLGLHYLWQGRAAEAEKEFTRALTLNAADAHAMVGMARLAARRRRWNCVVDWATQALTISQANLDAHRCLGQAYARTGQVQHAIRHYEHSLQLGLHGHKPLSWQILTCTQPGQMLDEGHCAAYSELARLLALRGEIERAISCYRIALSANFDTITDRMRLARLYLKVGRARDAAEQLRSAGRLGAATAIRIFHRAHRAISTTAGRLAALDRARA